MLVQALDGPYRKRRWWEVLEKLFHIHWHKVVRVAGVHTYAECRCGHRTYWRHRDGGYSAIDSSWLKEKRS